MTPKQKATLKLKAAQLSPVVFIGNRGLTDSVKKEIDRALTDHELIKIRFHGKDRKFRTTSAHLLCEELKAIFIHHVGHVIVIYRTQQET